MLMNLFGLITRRMTSVSEKYDDSPRNLVCDNGEPDGTSVTNHHQLEFYQQSHYFS